MKRVDWAKEEPKQIRGILYSAESLLVGKDVHAVVVDITL
jgi:hypothetical protein